MRLVIIEWFDTFGCSSSWENLSELSENGEPKPLICQSVGWLLHDGKESKVIVPHIADASENTAQQGCGDMTIPTCCIKSITDLTQAKNLPQEVNISGS